MTVEEEDRKPRNQTEFVLDRIDRRKSRFDKSAKILWYQTLTFRVLFFGISAAITVLAGLNLEEPNQNFSKWVLILGAISSFIAALSSFLLTEKYWLRNKIAHENMRILRERVKFQWFESGELTEEELKSFWEEYIEIMCHRSNHWKDEYQDTQINPLGRNETPE